MSCRRSHRDHVIGVFCTRENVVDTALGPGHTLMLVLVSPRPSSSWTLIFCTCRLVGRNSSFLSPFKWLALKAGPDEEENTPEHHPPEPRPTQKNLTSVVPEVRQGLLVACQNRLELGDDLTTKVLPAGRQPAELLQLTHPDHKENQRSRFQGVALLQVLTGQVSSCRHACVQQKHVLCVLYLEVSSCSSSLTNCWGTFRDRRLSAICSRTCRWFPLVVGNRYILDKVPPKTGGKEG